MLSTSNEIESQAAAIQQALPRLDTVPNIPNTQIPMIRTPAVNPKEYPLQLEVNGMDHGSLRESNVTKVAHHSEYSNAVKYIFGSQYDSRHDAIDHSMDPNHYSEQRKLRNISSTNCVDDYGLVPKPMPCDNMYMSKQKIMEIANNMIWRRNLLKNMEAQRQQYQIKDVYTKEYAKNKHKYTQNKHNNADYREFKTKYNVTLQHNKNRLRASLLEPMNDPNIMNVIMEKAVKPFLYQLHVNNLKYQQINEKKRKRSSSTDNSKVEMNGSDTDDSDDDVPINQRMKTETKCGQQKTKKVRKCRKYNISETVKKRLSKGSHSIILDEDKEKRIEQKKNDSIDPPELATHANPIPMELKYESERKLQLASMLNIEADNGNGSSENIQCWHNFLDITPSKDPLADIPHIHSCAARSMHCCLLNENPANPIPNKEEIRKSNEKWKREHQLEAKKMNRHPSPRQIMQNYTHNQQQRQQIKQIPMKSPRRRRSQRPIPQTLHAMNYNPTQYPSPQNQFQRGSYPPTATPTPNRRRQSQPIGVSGKSRKTRSGKGVSGKSASRNSVGSKRQRVVNPNLMRSHRSYSNALMSSTSTSNSSSRSSSHRSSPFGTTSSSQSVAYRQRIQAQRVKKIYNAQQNVFDKNDKNTQQMRTRQNNQQQSRLLSSSNYGYDPAALQRMRCNNSTTPLIHVAASPSITNSSSPFPQTHNFTNPQLTKYSNSNSRKRR